MVLSLPSLDYDDERDRIIEFIRKVVEESGVEGVVFGLSGGVDSSVSALICVEALGSGRVLGLVMPASFTPKVDVEDALWLADRFGFETEEIKVDRIVDAFPRSSEGGDASKLVSGNLRARIRMVLNYYYANKRRLLVVGTGDRSEYLLGYFTKFGDGAADFFPIIHLYKSEVRELGMHLGLPNRMAVKPASPQLWPGHRAVDELPADYTVLDPMLHGLFTLGLDPERVSREAKTPLSLARKVLKMNRRTEHKRIPGPKLERIEK